MHKLDDHPSPNGNEIAIVGMAGRFPQAQNIEELWHHVRDGVECIAFFSPEELRASGLPAAMLDHPQFVPAKGLLKDIEVFDAAFFGYSPREAQIIDPQQRLFLECAWQALEHAGYAAPTYPGRIGVYAGLGFNTYFAYLLLTLAHNPELSSAIDAFQLVLANDKDFVTTRVSYKLNLRGPSINVQTACSTALVAVHLACQSLLNAECDMALAGGASIHAPQESGYIYQEGGIASPDGHCRAFDARAQGTISGSGLGIVVLKRLEDALADHDYIHAVIKGTACNNDGALKIGYTAPSAQAQAEVIAEAIAMAGISAETISYIETHGTATPLGDPIEIAGLTQAFRTHTARRSFCAIGSVKTNLGHLDAAAGIAGLIKTVCALQHHLLPASLHFEVANPQIDFAASPFYVNERLTPWKRGQTPLRAGVSSFGIGGTNAHVVLEEAPPLPAARGRVPRAWHLLVVSAKTATALQQARANLLSHLQQHPEQELVDVAYTLQVGRSLLTHRLAAVCRDRRDTLAVLETADPTRLFQGIEEATERSVTFLFPGQGSQYVGMGQELYQQEPLFREEIDRCAGLLLASLGRDIRSVLYPEAAGAEQAAQHLQQTWLTQPILFVLEYALAKLWEAWGIRPQAMIGHSLGEYVAACLAGVFSLEVALHVVALRGRLMQQLAPGAMLAVSLSQAQLEEHLGRLGQEDAQHLSLAAVNTPQQCVVAGVPAAVQALEQHLSAQGIACQGLQSAHAFHSRMVEPMLAEFLALLSALPLQAPQLRYISNVSGTWITAQQATDPHYWVQHLRQEVRFAQGVATLLRETEGALLEVGPGSTLSLLVKAQLPPEAPQVLVSSMRRAWEVKSDVAWILTSLGRLWLAGARVGWQGLYADEPPQRLPLPTYPFEGQRYWIERLPPRERVDEEQEAVPRSQPPVAEPAERLDAAQGVSARAGLATAYVAPRTELERQVASIWGRQLGIEQVGVDDNFFELGGHSLLAAQIIARVRSSLQVELAISVLLEKMTVAGLAAVIEQQVGGQKERAVPQIPPLATAQELLEKLEGLTDEEVEALLQKTVEESRWT